MTICWSFGTGCSSLCRAWSKTDKECDFIMAARALKRLGKTTRLPGPPGVQT